MHSIQEGVSQDCLKNSFGEICTTTFIHKQITRMFSGPVNRKGFCIFLYPWEQLDKCQPDVFQCCSAKLV